MSELTPQPHVPGTDLVLADARTAEIQRTTPGKELVVARPRGSEEYDFYARREAGGAARELGTGDRWDFFVSCVEQDKDWAEYIAGTLGKKYRVCRPEVWDWKDPKYVASVDRVLASTDRTLAVLSPAYLQAEHEAAVWHQAWSSDPIGRGRKLIPIKIQDCNPEGFLRDITPINLTPGKGYELASASTEQQLRAEIDASVTGRRSRPAGPPRFPGSR